jgi:RNA polymerase sigma-70 factor (ECF subfamily)
MSKAAARPPIEQDYQGLDDETLASSATDDLDAFAELYRRYQCRVFRFLRARTSDAGLAEDLTAQVFFRALASAPTFRRDGTYRAWLFTIASNCLSTWRRHRARTSEVSLDEAAETIDPGPTPHAQVIVDHDRNVVRRTISKLPIAQREVVTLRYLRELSIDEIASSTRRSPGAVRILLHRARTNLRRSMELV